MADSTPFLSRSNSIESKRPPSLDEAIEERIGEFGWAQFLQALFVSLAWTFDAQQTFISVFTDVEPKWHCVNDSCNSSSNICKFPKFSWSWDLPPNSSIVSEWGLECANSLVRGLPASSFFMGCLVGGLLLTSMADSSLGRKNMIFLSCLAMSVSALLTASSANIWIYSAWRFACGIGRASIGTSALVLSTELVGKRWRGQVGTLGFLCFTLGFLSLPAIAYINEGSSWRSLYLWTSIPTIFYSLLFRLFVHESPRWLFVRGHKQEAVSILNSISSPKNCTITLSFSNISVEQETQNDALTTIKILLKKSWCLRRLLTTMTSSLGIGMVYYGMPLSLGNLSFNLYLSVALNALSELPAALVTFLIVGKVDRKVSLLAFTILSWICNAMCAVLGKSQTTLQLWLELVSFFSACTAFNILLIFAIELFPTCVRNSAISLVRQAVVLGGVFSPVVVAAGRRNATVSYGIFALSIGLCGLFVVGLPETRGKTICDTMEEEERKLNASLII
ncbi:organic cation/carnitine transporter 3-like [Mangifera indica]|uniref:organic cation/carnitine transporter 3-like n=1 Tax=Mangifera indica TaxID=29780 RepID=UPI001CFA2770|nr:organic cation/carnitine transporter 3-like [Mangifera indica]